MYRVFNQLFVLLLCGICMPAYATTVHKWIDADGVTHFSDAPPAGSTIEVNTLELNDNFPPVAKLEADYYSIANQWKRMRDEREAKTKLRLERARIRAEESAALAHVVGENVAYGGYPLYTLPYGRHYGDRHAGGIHYHDHRSTAGRGRHHVRAHGRHVAAGAAPAVRRGRLHGLS